MPAVAQALTIARRAPAAQVGVAQAFESARARGGVRLALAAGALAAAGLALYFGWRRLGGPQLLGSGLSRRRAPCPRPPGPGCAQLPGGGALPARARPVPECQISSLLRLGSSRDCSIVAVPCSCPFHIFRVLFGGPRK